MRWYCKYGISYHELQEMLDERGVSVDHTTIYRWVQHYASDNPKLCAALPSALEEPSKILVLS